MDIQALKAKPVNLILVILCLLFFYREAHLLPASKTINLFLALLTNICIFKV